MTRLPRVKGREILRALEIRALESSAVIKRF